MAATPVLWHGDFHGLQSVRCKELDRTYKLSLSLSFHYSALLFIQIFCMPVKVNSNIST